ncbi:MAG: hypothetical protein LBP22_00355 [Deltaproteobacteria bacterium]|jgi:hypothetical protein|nr:hypothetical protein [Deltaproteobacteria bacterium]
MPCPDKLTVKAYVTPEEFAEIQEYAKDSGLSLSAYAKEMCLRGEVKSKLDKALILELSKISADLGRIGGLLKLGLSEGKLERKRGNELYYEIQELKREMAVKIRDL